MGRLGKKKTFKKGAASFYIVAFSTLILVIIAASFAAIIISEITRTSNDDLAQSAYDSAMAGVEDAKLAFYNYQNCLAQGKTKADHIQDDGILTCEEIIYIMEDKSDDCDMVAMILGRTVVNDDGFRGVMIQESSVQNNMLQAYTCVKIQNVLNDYRSTLSGSNPSEIVRVKLDDKSGLTAKDIKTVEISWYSDASNLRLTYNNFNRNTTPNKVVFNSLTTGIALPPTISVTLIQTANSFKLSDFTMKQDNRTNRATVFMVPTDSAQSASKEDNKTNYIGAYRTGGDGVMRNLIKADDLLKSNDKTTVNVPYAVYCGKNLGNEFLCTATLVLPEPVGGDRNDDTFLFVVSLPYGKPATDYAMRFCNNANACTTQKVTVDGKTELENHEVALKGVQVSIDSTGRANDLFRRVETRFKGADTVFSYPLYAIQLMDSDNNAGTLLKKSFDVRCEWNLPSNIAQNDSYCNSQ